MLWASIGLHAALLVVFLVSPAPSAVAPRQAITVDLVAMVPQVAPAPVPEAPEPAPAEPAPVVPEPPEVVLPEPAPPEPERPRPAEVVLPERPREPAKPKPEPKPKPRREVVLRPKPKVERDLDDLLAQMRDEAGETAPTPQPVVEAAVAPEASGGGVPISPEEAAWNARVKAHIRRTWVVPFDFRDQSLETHVTLSLDASGALRGPPRLDRSSGNLAYDDGVLDGIKRAAPLPAPPEAGDWRFVFPSEDY